ncbi:MAG: sigma-70 family RNA polymerase sigma factor [Planctomycetota bacterium]
MPERDDDPHQWLSEHGDALYAYALRHTGRQQLSEDLVQDTLLAAWKHRATFRGDATRRTWLTAILRRRLIDEMRREKSRGGLPVLQPAAKWFDDRQRWDPKPGQWGANPDSALESREFWDVLHRCMDGLPPDQAEAFNLRTLRDRPTEECCKKLGVSTSNLGVRLHRARLALRRCLELRWFQPAATRKKTKPAASAQVAEA